MSKNKYGGINDMETGWTKEPLNRKIYTLWFDILRRCYDTEQLLRNRGKSYADCTVCNDWFYLSRFVRDIQNIRGYEEWVKNENMSIDKDLFSNGNKEYSLKNCCFIPMSVNIKEMNKRHPELVNNLHIANKTKYILTNDKETLIFNSESEACQAMGVHKCTISSCYRRNSKCKGYTIYQGASMDGDLK